MHPFFKQTRFWLLLFVGLQVILFIVYSYPLLKSFQRTYSSIFIIAILITILLINKKWLLYPLLVSAVFINPVFTLSVATSQFRFKILWGILVILLIIFKRKELRFIVLILLITNIGLLLVQQYQIQKIDSNFRNESQLYKEPNRLYLQVDSAIESSSNVYAIVLDGYPDFKILDDSFHYQSKLSDSVRLIEWQQPFTIYYHSPVSLLFLFGSRKITSEEYPEYLLTNRVFMEKSLYNSPLAENLQQNNYSFSFNSLMLDYPGAWENPFNPVAFWPQYSINDITYLVWRYGILKKRGRGQSGSLKKYHHELFEELIKSSQAKEKKMAIFHFMTFHNSLETIDKDALYADSLGLSAVNTIIVNDPNATIIVMSDHGERRYLKNKANYHKGIYGIRRGY